MTDSKTKALIAIKKAKTSLEKIEKMIIDDKYCIDIIQQNLAIIGLLKSTNLKLLEGHLDCCVKKSILSGNKDDLQNKFDEIVNIIRTFQNK
nr:metal-sensing transcriptional repressor [Candidatus Gracilibacteria bacterium]